MMSTWAAHSAQAASMRSASVSRSPFCCGLVAGRMQGVTAGQPSLIICGAGEGWTGAQPLSSSRQSSTSPVAQVLIFMGELLDLMLPVGELLADLLLLSPQCHLCLAFGLQLCLQLINDQLPACTVSAGLLGSGLGCGAGGRDSFNALLLQPDQQGQGGDQCHAVQRLAQSSHAAACSPSLCLL